MFIELVVTYCLLSDANTCKIDRPSVDPAAISTPMGCMVVAQQKVSDFLRDHPAYRVIKMGCEISNKRQINA